MLDVQSKTAYIIQNIEDCQTTFIISTQAKELLAENKTLFGLENKRGWLNRELRRLDVAINHHAVLWTHSPHSRKHGFHKSRGQLGLTGGVFWC